LVVGAFSFWSCWFLSRRVVDGRNGWLVTGHVTPTTVSLLGMRHQNGRVFDGVRAFGMVTERGLCVGSAGQGNGPDENHANPSPTGQPGVSRGVQVHTATLHRKKKTRYMGGNKENKGRHDKEESQTRCKKHNTAWHGRDGKVKRRAPADGEHV
jgi:hypothetical protein